MRRASAYVLSAVLIVCLVLVLMPTAASAAGNRYIVKFRDPAAGRAAIARAGGQVVLDLPQVGAAAAVLPEAAVRGLRRSPAVEYVDLDPKRYPAAQEIPYGIDMVQAPLVWGGADGAGIRMCVIDSGLYVSHEDLRGGSVSGYPAGWDHDACGHGTHVTGTIAALDNATGVVGVNPAGIDLFVVKVFGDDCAWAYASTLIDAAFRCRDAGAKVISMSLGGTFKDRTEERAFRDLYQKDGVLSVAAAGNDGNTRHNYPASYDSVISVAAVDANELHADFSQRTNQVELSAPGVAVLSTVGWNDENSLTVNGTTYTGGHVEFSGRTGGLTGTVVDGGLCTTSGSWSGAVVLCERGSVSFYEKVMAVEAGGGAAAVIYNNEPGGFLGTLGDGNSSVIPGISLSQEDGQAVVAAALGASGTVVSQYVAPASGYEAWDGTSMATPHVSGVAALLWSNFPSASNADIRSALSSTAKDLGAAGRDDLYGYGLVQAKAAADFLAGSGGGGGGGGGGTAPISLAVSTYKARGELMADLTWSGASGGDVDVLRDGSLLWTTANDGAETDATGEKGGATHSYQVCEVDGSACSDTVSASW